MSGEDSEYVPALGWPRLPACEETRALACCKASPTKAVIREAIAELEAAGFVRQPPANWAHGHPLVRCECTHPDFHVTVFGPEQTLPSQQPFPAGWGPMEYWIPRWYADALVHAGATGIGGFSRRDTPEVAKTVARRAAYFLGLSLEEHDALLTVAMLGDEFKVALAVRAIIDERNKDT